MNIAHSPENRHCDEECLTVVGPDPDLKKVGPGLCLSEVCPGLDLGP